MVMSSIIVRQMRVHPEEPNLRPWYVVETLEDLPEWLDPEAGEISPEFIQASLEGDWCGPDCSHWFKVSRGKEVLFDTAAHFALDAEAV